MKPANVLLAGDEGAHVYLTDFGLTSTPSSGTRLTQTGDMLGTVEYMAPEQLEAAGDARTDVYALGCVLYTALTGRPPFSRATYAATMLAHLGEPPPQPSATEGVPAAFDAVIARALAKRPEDRYHSARDLVEAALTAAGTPAERRRHPGRPARRKDERRPRCAHGGAAGHHGPVARGSRRSNRRSQAPTARISRARPTRLPRGLAAAALALAAARPSPCCSRSTRARSARRGVRRGQRDGGP